MGALRKVMPITAASFIIGWLAIAGVPPFSGFWSKDEILAYAWDKSPILWFIGVVTAAAHRLLHDPPGDPGVLRQGAVGRGSPDLPRGARRALAEARGRGCRGGSTTVARPRGPRRPPPHESPWMMTTPLVVLAFLVGALFGGLLNLPVQRRLDFLHQWLEPVFVEADAPPTLSEPAEELLLVIVSGLRGRGASSSPTSCTQRHRIKAVEPDDAGHGWYVDEARGGVRGRSRRRGVRGRCVSQFDQQVVDGAVNGTGAMARPPPGAGCAGSRPARPQLRPRHRHRRGAAARLVRAGRGCF